MKILTAVGLLIIMLLTPYYAFAAAPEYSIRPSNGKVQINKNFTIDLLIDSNNNDVSYARATLEFDPTILQVVSAKRNASLFCDYPEAEQSVDNTGGLLMVTGFCQSGVDEPYRTSGSADVFARVVFKAISIGDAKISWNWSGEDVPFESVIMKDGSPPRNLLISKPGNVTFDVVRNLSSGSNNPPTSGETPSTGLGLSFGLLAGGFVLVSLGFAYVKLSERQLRSKLKTVVLNGKQK